ncbi:MAG: hypothetical protein Tp136SUR676911_41 [Prokaryotic dsDNA virus sp.]|nr:MAG: hypothetical protein Tp136SUR676911_41 [Prokaryotic dsDNA virus sp.]|tara:strand:+ start:27685 stop:28116 length:432 start_codon:yes stop_codon:yes gene_type:complete
MTQLTTEHIKAILIGAPDVATHYEIGGIYYRQLNSDGWFWFNMDEWVKGGPSSLNPPLYSLEHLYEIFVLRTGKETLSQFTENENELPKIGEFVEIKEWVNTWEVLRYFTHKELGYGAILCCHTKLNSFGFLPIDDFKERLVK